MSTIFQIIFDLKISIPGEKIKIIKKIRFNLIGSHNILKSVAAISLCLHIGINIKIINRFYSSSNNIGFNTSIFSMIGMGVGCFAIIIALSVMNGFENQVHQRLKGFEGDLHLLHNGEQVDYFSNIQGIELTMPYMER